MKFFSLIKDEKIHPSGDKKIIPAEEYAKLVTAQEILDEAKTQAEDYRAEVNKECETLKEEAKQKGFEEGVAQWSQQLALLEKEKEKVRKEMENAIVPLALAAIKKLIGRELEAKPEMVVDIVATALKGVSHHRKVAIFLNRSDLEHVERNRQRIKDLFEHLESLSISARDDIEEGNAAIETEAGIIKVDVNLWVDALGAALKGALANQSRTTP